MNKRILALVALLLLVLCGLFLFQSGKKNASQSAETDFVKDEPVEIKSPPQGIEISEEEQLLLEQFTPEEVENLKYNHSAAQAANQNVTFYGLCVDQDGNPIEGVRIQARVTKMRKSMVSVVINDSFKYYEELEVVTGKDGRFKFIDEGSLLVLESIGREGYLDACGASRGYSFGRILTGATMAGIHKGNPLKPVVFTLWKKGEGSAATEINDRNGARADFGIEKSGMGKSVYFDLSSRIKTSSPSENSMEVVAQNSADRRWDPEIQKGVGQGRYKAWSFTFRIPGGGFYPTNDLFLFRPPEEGYEEFFSIDIPEGEDGWVNEIKGQQLYFKTTAGNYGAFVFDAVATAEGAIGFRLKKLVFNPTGERNLENF